MQTFQEAEEKIEVEANSAGASKSGKRQNPKLVDSDPNGEKLLQVSPYL